MSTIVAYRKYIDANITRELQLPEDSATRERLGSEIATVDGITYVSLQDGAVLPAQQPKEIEASVATVAITDAMLGVIKDASPHVRLINARVRAAIAERYSIEDEIQLLRTAPNPEFTAYNAYVEECLAWGRAEKLKLGL